MITRTVLFSLATAAAMAAICGTASANSVGFDVTSSNSDTAQIWFTSGLNSLDVSVTNTSVLTAAQITDAISQITFTLKSNSGFSVTGLTELKGVGGFNPPASTVTTWTLANGTGFFDHTPVTSADQWKFTAGPGVWALGGGNPFNMILPGSGTTSDSGNSIHNGSPYLIGTTDFILSVDGGMTASTDISKLITSVTVGYGTGPESSGTSNKPIDGGDPPPVVPLPDAAWSGLAMLGGMAGYAKLRRRLA